MANNLGALWTNTSKAGLEYYKGSINWKGDKIKIVVFANTKKDPNDPEQERLPDYTILLDAPRSRG